MHVKFVEDPNPYVGVVWKFREWDTSSDVIVVKCPMLNYDSAADSQRVALKERQASLRTHKSILRTRLIRIKK
ncbi:hypothetical protein TNCV_222951 [Trichonephila clavipes]|nr:hypothetical protein TNCV_222951 [Trichonephila clavipes]